MAGGEEAIAPPGHDALSLCKSKSSVRPHQCHSPGFSLHVLITLTIHPLTLYLQYLRSIFVGASPMCLGPCVYPNKRFLGFVWGLAPSLPAARPAVWRSADQLLRARNRGPTNSDTSDTSLLTSCRTWRRRAYPTLSELGANFCYTNAEACAACSLRITHFNSIVPSIRIVISP